MKYLSYLFTPLVFGIGFFAPLIAQCLTQAGVAVAGVDNLVIGLLVGGLWGAMAQVRGSWVWVKP